MSRRMIDSSILLNEKVGELPMEARLLLIGMVLLADDQGRVKANPAWLRSQIFAYDNIDIEDIRQALHGISNNDTILIYEIDGKQYAQLVNWWKYQHLQYASPSKLPKPPNGWKDRIRITYTKGSILTCNWILGNGVQVADSCDEAGNPVSKKTKQVKQSPDDSQNEQQNEQVVNQVNEQVNVHLSIEDQDQDKDQDHIQGERDVDSSGTPPPPSSSPESSNGLDPTTLELMTRWSGNKQNARRVRISPAHAKIVDAQRMSDPPSKVQAASPVEPNPETSRVISSTEGQIIIPVAEWTGMMGTMLDGLGLRGAVDCGGRNSERTKADVSFTLEALVRMSPKFRSKDGVNAIFAAWYKAKPNGPAPAVGWLEEFASKYLSGKIRYPGENDNGRTSGNPTKSQGQSGAEGLPDRSATFDYFKWQADVASGKYKNEPF